MSLFAIYYTASTVHSHIKNVTEVLKLCALRSVRLLATTLVAPMSSLACEAARRRLIRRRQPLTPLSVKVVALRCLSACLPPQLRNLAHGARAADTFHFFSFILQEHSRYTKMRLLVLCSLALAAWACAGVRAQEDDPNRRVSCLPCRPEDAAASNCTNVQSEQCHSGRTVRCGCCDTCVVYIGDREYCVGAIPTNGVCNPPMRCEFNQCRNP